MNYESVLKIDPKVALPLISASEDANTPVPSTAEHVIKIVSPDILQWNILIIF